MTSFDGTVLAFMEASGLDRENSETIIHEFCKQTVSLIVDIKRLISEGDHKEVGILLHKLKGSAGNVRVHDIAKQALEAEEAVKLMDNLRLSNLLQQMEESLQALM